ncbi:OmpA family protein [Marinobacter sp.]|uniref:OmpA family protein n=1 Tax=Marinobacter sp. TaxID=50741 RepID=UPI003A924E83
MTVLVLDNPELIAKAAVAYGFNPATFLTENRATEDKPPHRVRFHYGFNKHALDASDTAIILQHATYLRQHPTLSVRIHGHSDNFGAEDYNRFLSRLRTNAVTKLLIKEGVAESRILVASWGSARPLATPDDRAANRRVELEYLTHDMAKAL